MSDLVKRFIEVLEDNGYEPRRYSGRGMYGRVCVGAVLPSGTSAFVMGLQVAQEMGEDSIYDLAEYGVSEDSLGLDTIIYWPSMGWPEGVEESNEDEADDE